MQAESSVLSSLPSTADRPDADVVIFDGQCPFCRAQVERLAAWDRKGRLAFVSLHDPEVARRWPDLSHEQLMEEMYVVDQQGRRHGGALALRYLARRLPRLWVLLPLLFIPGSLPLWRSLYRWVARRRYQLRGLPPCDDGTCRIHSRS